MAVFREGWVSKSWARVCLYHPREEATETKEGRQKSKDLRSDIKPQRGTEEKEEEDEVRFLLFEPALDP